MFEKSVGSHSTGSLYLHGLGFSGHAGHIYTGDGKDSIPAPFFSARSSTPILIMAGSAWNDSGSLFSEASRVA